MGIPREVLGEAGWETDEWGSEWRYTDESGASISYQDWSPSSTKVVSGPYGANKFPGRWFPDRLVARRYWLARAGKIIEEYAAPGRWMFRVRRDA